MHRFRNILVPIGGDPSRQSVLTQAARLAKQHGAAIKLIAVKPDGFVFLVVQDTKAFSAVVLFTASWGSSAGSGKQGNRDRIPLRPRS